MIRHVEVEPQSQTAQSLKRHLEFGLALFTLLLSASLTFLVGFIATEDVSRQVGMHLADTAKEVRNKLDRQMQDIYSELDLVAGLGGEAGGANPFAVRREYINGLLKANPEYAWIGFADNAGQIMTATSGLFEGDSVADESWFKRGQDGAFLEDVHAVPLLEKKLAAKAGAPPQRFVTIAVPVRNRAGRVIGVLGAHLNWEVLHGQERPLKGEQAADNPTQVLILSRDGSVLHGPETMNGVRLDERLVEQSLRARKPWSLQEWPGDRTYLAAANLTQGAKGYPGAGWVVVARQSADDALATVNRLRFQVATVSGLIGLAFVGLAWWFAARISEPLAAIAAAAELVSKEGWKGEIPALGGYREIERLSRSLRTMLASLRRHEEDISLARDQLESRVHERSEDLMRTQAELETALVEREFAQRDSERARAQLDTALDAAQMAVWTLDVATGKVELSTQWAKIIGGPAGTTTTSVAEMVALVPLGERGRVGHAFFRALKGQVSQYSVQHYVRSTTGGLIPTVSRGGVIERGADGRALRMAGTVRVIDVDAEQTLPPRRLAGRT